MGRSTALEFVNEVAMVVINDKDETGLYRAAEEMQELGSPVVPVTGDITKNETREALVGKAMAQYGKIDILFNYVEGEPASGPFRPFLEQTEQYLDKMIDLNLESTILLCKAVFGHMIQNRTGRGGKRGFLSGFR